MTLRIPRITTLKPVVLPDQKRVMMEMVVEDLPAITSNVSLDLPGTTDPASSLANRPAPYPNIELSILDSQGRTVATAFIVEHKEPSTNLTLHLHRPDFREKYTARAEMTYQEQTLQLVEIPFVLDKAQL